MALYSSTTKATMFGHSFSNRQQFHRKKGNDFIVKNGEYHNQEERPNKKIVADIKRNIKNVAIENVFKSSGTIV